MEAIRQWLQTTSPASTRHETGGPALPVTSAGQSTTAVPYQPLQLHSAPHGSSLADPVPPAPTLSVWAALSPDSVAVHAELRRYLAVFEELLATEETHSGGPAAILDFATGHLFFGRSTLPHADICLLYTSDAADE